MSRCGAAAVLGAGIMGSSVALLLARRGVRVSLIDAAAEPFAGASRWNEGKIHLGYLYGADPSLATARALIPGGLRFRGIVEQLLDRRLPDAVVTPHGDRYVIHRRSVASAEQVWALAQRISALTRAHESAQEYFGPLEPPRLLSRREIDASYDGDTIVAAIEVPERSVSTPPIADWFVDALHGTPGIEIVVQHRVARVSEHRGQWMVHTQEGSLGPFDAVVNALWEGRPAVDATVGLATADAWTHRYRVSIFARTKRPVDVRSAVIAVGPFGDVKSYDGTSLYLSWYDAGLLAESHDLQAPRAPELSATDAQRVADETLERLASIIRGIGEVRERVETLAVRGGWVYAVGRGGLRDVRSELHRRDRVGTLARRGYFSVDTGKYSIAPALALQVADAIA